MNSIRRFSFAALAFILTATLCQSQIERDSIHQFLRSHFGFSRDDLSAMDDGQIITKLVKTSNPAEFAVCGAVHFRLPLDSAVQELRRIETFKKSSSVPEVGRLSVPPDTSNFDKLTLEQEDIHDLRNCKPGDCKIKLSVAMMERFHKEVDWNSPDYPAKALSLTKEMLVDDARSYLARGNAALGEYDDADYALHKGDELADILREQPNLFDYAPGLQAFLDNYPNASLPNTTDFLFWQKEVFGKIKPIISFNHVTICRPVAGRSNTVIASEQLYANHYFEASLVVSAWLEDTSQPGFYTIYLNRSRFDDLRKKGIFDMRSAIRDQMYKRIQDELEWTKERIESLYKSSKEERN